MRDDDFVCTTIQSCSKRYTEPIKQCAPSTCYYSSSSTAVCESFMHFFNPLFTIINKYVKVNGEIAKTSGGAVNRTNIILIVTDGGLSDQTRAVQQVLSIIIINM